MYKKFQAENGLTVIASPMPEMTSVSLGVWIGVGGRYESKAKSGISHFIEHMLFKGTHTRTAKELKQSIEGVGGAFNGFTSDEVTCYMIKVPAKYMELGIDVLTDMVLDPRFDEVDIMHEKFVIREEIKMYHDQPADYVLDLLSRLMWHGDALGRALTGSVATVKDLKRSELLRFKEEGYHPNNIAVIAAGKLAPEEIFDYSCSKFKDKKKRKKSSFKTPLISQTKPRMKFYHGSTQQAHIAMGFPIAKSNIREQSALKLMNVIFGGNMSSRLFEALRERSALCYDITSSYKRYSDIEELEIHAGVDNRKTLKAIIAILGELKKLKDEGVTKDELRRAKEFMKGQFLLAIEGTSSRMMWLGDGFMVHKEIPEIRDLLNEIDDVTVSDISKVCHKVFKAASSNLAVIGNLAENEKAKIVKELDAI